MVELTGKDAKRFHEYISQSDKNRISKKEFIKRQKMVRKILKKADIGGESNY